MKLRDQLFNLTIVVVALAAILAIAKNATTTQAAPGDPGIIAIELNVTVNGQTTDSQLVDGTYEFEIENLSGTEHRTCTIQIDNGHINGAFIQELPFDTYTITENITGFAGKQISVNGGNIKQVTLTDIEPYVTVYFTNNRKAGSIKITNTVLVNGAAVTAANRTLADRTYTFEVRDVINTIGTPIISVNSTIQNGVSNSVIVDNLPYGTYSVYEDTTPLNALGIDVRVVNSQVANEIEVTVDDTVPEVTFIHDKIVGTIRINKNVTVNGQSTTGALADGSYSFEVVRDSDHTVVATPTVTIVNGASSYADVENLDLGNYTVSEDVAGLAAKGMSLASSNALHVQLNGLTEEVTFTNNLNAKLDSTFQIIWDDDNDRDGLRPADVQVQLYTQTGTSGPPTAHGSPVTLSALNNWSTTAVNLDRFDSSDNEITYSWGAVSSMPSEYTLSRFSNYPDMTFTLTHTPVQVRPSGDIKWLDDNDYDGIRPNSLTLNLYADGVKIDSIVATASNSVNWHYYFGWLPRYRDGGTEITYSVEVDSVPAGYSVLAHSGPDISLSHTPELIDVEIDVAWAADLDLDVEAEFELYNSVGGTPVMTGNTISANMSTSANGKFQFTNLRRYDGTGHENTYSVVMIPRSIKKNGAIINVRYSTDVSNGTLSGNIVGFGITCTQLIEIPVQKTWVGGEQDSDIQVQAYKKAPGDTDYIAAKDDTGRYITATLNKANNWQATMTDLPKYASVADAASHNPIGYTVKELSNVPGYTTTISGDQENGYKITNTRETTTVKVQLAWDDNNNSSGSRPAKVTLNLLKDGTLYDTVEVQPGNGGIWQYSWADLDKYSGTSLINWTVTENAIDGYATSSAKRTDGTVVFTNTREKETGSLTVELVIDSTTASEKNRSITFAVILRESNGTTPANVTGVFGDMTFTQGTAVFSLRDGESKTATGLQAGLMYEVSPTLPQDMTAAQAGAIGVITKTGAVAKITLTGTASSTQSGEVWVPYVYKDEKTFDSAELDYRSTLSGNMAWQVKQAIVNGTGKWVRYSDPATETTYGGWYTISTGTEEKTYYYDKITGMKATGWTVVDGVRYHFDSVSGERLQ